MLKITSFWHKHSFLYTLWCLVALIHKNSKLCSSEVSDHSLGCWNYSWLLNSGWLCQLSFRVTWMEVLWTFNIYHAANLFPLKRSKDKELGKHILSNREKISCSQKIKEYLGKAVNSWVWLRQSYLVLNVVRGLSYRKWKNSAQWMLQNLTPGDCTYWQWLPFFIFTSLHSHFSSFLDLRNPEAALSPTFRSDSPVPTAPTSGGPKPSTASAVPELVTDPELEKKLLHHLSDLALTLPTDAVSICLAISTVMTWLRQGWDIALLFFSSWSVSNCLPLLP